MAITLEMASSSSAYLSGAVEHAPSYGALAFSNLGLSGDAVRGNRWPKHRARVLKLIVDLLRARRLLGVLLNGVGWVFFNDDSCGIHLSMPCSGSQTVPASREDRPTESPHPAQVMPAGSPCVGRGSSNGVPSSRAGHASLSMPKVPRVLD